MVDAHAHAHPRITLTVNKVDAHSRSPEIAQLYAQCFVHPQSGIRRAPRQSLAEWHALVVNEACRAEKETPAFVLSVQQ